MSSRQFSKSMKRSASRKRVPGETPDNSSDRVTPTTSASSIGIEKRPESSIDNVLTGDEVEALRIKEENLAKVHPPRQSVSDKVPKHVRKVAVRKTQLPEVIQQKKRQVAVLRPLTPGTSTAATQTKGSVEGLPIFNQGGTVVPHSVLGPSEDNAVDLKNTQMIESTSVSLKVPPVTLPEVKTIHDSKQMSHEKISLIQVFLCLHLIAKREARSDVLGQKHETKNKAPALSGIVLHKISFSHILGGLSLAKMDSSPDKLLMNQGDSYRAVQEERTLIDRPMAAVDYGKGYRVGSEFWNQPVLIGDACTGIHTTLTRTERGLPPELEFVGIPTIVREERGVPSFVECNAPAHHTWDQSSYFQTRRDQLIHPSIDTHRPEMSELQVIGRAPGHTEDLPFTNIMKTDSLDSMGENDSNSEEDDGPVPRSILDLYVDVVQQPIIGPALLIDNQLLKWEGNPLMQACIGREPLPQRSSKATQSYTDIRDKVVPKESSTSLHEYSSKKAPLCLSQIDFRVLFESGRGVVTTSNVKLENCGTAAVYYSWQPLPKPNPLGTVEAGETQRFFFDVRGGVLLPGQKIAVSFVFKSPNAGIFSETWLLQTGPVLCRGRPIVFTLKGVTFQDDVKKEKRDELERKLKHRMAVAAAERLVNRLVNSIRARPQPPETIHTIEMEENVFRDKNQGLYYHHSVVQQLKALYVSILQPQQEESKPEKTGAGKKGDGIGKGKDKTASKDKRPSKEKDDVISEETPLSQKQENDASPPIPDWDLSIASLQEVILAVEDRAVVNDKLQKLSSLVGLLSFPPQSQIKRNNYYIVYEALCEAIDLMSAMSAHLCQIMGLPVIEFSKAVDETGISAENSNVEPDGNKTPSQSNSLLAPTGKDKKGSKKGTDKSKAGKEADKSKTGKEAKGAGTKVKPLPNKKFKTHLSGRELIPVKEHTTAPADVDPILRDKYKENFRSIVYKILGTMADNIEALLEE